MREISDVELAKALRKRVTELARLAAECGLQHVSMFADLDGGTFVFASARREGEKDSRPMVCDFLGDGEVGR